MGRLCGFGDLIGPQAPAAHADSADAAVDHGADFLQVRLESAGADVMSVADGAPDDRLLATD